MEAGTCSNQFSDADLLRPLPFIGGPFFVATGVAALSVIILEREGGREGKGEGEGGREREREREKEREREREREREKQKRG